MMRSYTTVIACLLATCAMTLVGCGDDDSTGPASPAVARAVIDGPASPVLNCFNTGEASYDGFSSEGEISAYEWLVDGVVAGTGPEYKLFLADLDPVALTLRVVDDAGEILDESTLSVQPDRPEAAGCTSEIGMVGPPGRLIREGTASRTGTYRLDLPETATPVGIEWSISSPDGTNGEIAASGDGRSADITFFDVGSYVVRATVDFDSGTESVEMPVEVVTGPQAAPEGTIAIQRDTGAGLALHFMDGETGVVGPPVFSDPDMDGGGSCFEGGVILQLKRSAVRVRRANDLFLLRHSGLGLTRILHTDGSADGAEVAGNLLAFTDNGRPDANGSAAGPEPAVYDFTTHTFRYLAGDTPKPEYRGFSSISISENGVVAYPSYRNDQVKVHLYDAVSGDDLGALVDRSARDAYGYESVTEFASAWNRDGSRIALVIDVQSQSPSFQQVVITDSEGQEVETLAKGGSPLGFLRNEAVLFTRRNFDTGRGDIWSVSLDTGELTNLTAITVPEGEPVTDVLLGYCG